MTIAALALAALLAVPFGKGVYDGYHESDATEDADRAKPAGPAFSADSAYAHIVSQCDFGPRAMNTEGHARCAEWIAAKFGTYGCRVTRQRADLTGYDGTLLRADNIMAAWHPERTTRVLIAAHWDSRPWADNDPDSANWRKPILAANDAASGVGVMLELARLLNGPDGQVVTVGVDFLCLDAEDWGTPQWAATPDDENSWALGARHWATHLPPGYEARYGILLDMVGGQGARFYREAYSMQYAPQIVSKVWRAARAAGQGSYFPRQDGGMITDDHVPLNRDAGIATIDIIPYYPDCAASNFGPTWHTLADDPAHIDRATLRAVGQTLVQTLWTEE